MRLLANLGSYLAGEEGEGGHLARTRSAVLTGGSSLLSGAGAAYTSTLFIPSETPSVVISVAVLVGLGWTGYMCTLESSALSLVRKRRGWPLFGALAARAAVFVPAALQVTHMLLLGAFGIEVGRDLGHQQEQNRSAEVLNIEQATRPDMSAFTGAIRDHEKSLQGLQQRIADAEQRRDAAAKAELNASKERRVIYIGDGATVFDRTTLETARANRMRLTAQVRQVRQDLKPQIDHHQGEIKRLQETAEKEHQRLEKKRRDAIEAVRASPVDVGLLDRLESLQRVTSSNQHAMRVYILLMLLLIALEAAPLCIALGERAEDAIDDEAGYARKKLRRASDVARAKADHEMAKAKCSADIARARGKERRVGQVHRRHPLSKEERAAWHEVLGRWTVQDEFDERMRSSCQSGCTTQSDHHYETQASTRIRIDEQKTDEPKR